MDSKEPRFNPEFSFLEDKNILKLDNMIDEVVNSDTNKENKKRLLSEIKSRWDHLQKEYIEKSKTDDAGLRNFLLFVSYNVRKMSAGGLNIGRSEISDFIDEKSKELTPYFDKYYPQ